MNWAVETFSLTKYFPPAGSGLRLAARPGQSRAAVDQVSLTVKPGELFGLLGPNGAGKTTLIKMLATLITPSAGTARINGHDLAETEAVRRSITLTNGDGRSFYWRLTGRQNLEFFAALYHLPRSGLDPRIRECLELVGLEEAADTPVRTYSTGMKQRLAIAQALLHQNPILLLDEPTRGLDPAATRHFHRLLQEELAGQRSLTVLLATHQLWEAEALCQRVAVMHQGRLQGCGSPAELRRDLGFTERWRLVLQNLTPNLKRRLEELPLPLCITFQGGGRFWIEWDDDKSWSTEEMVQVICGEGGKILGLSQEQASLDAIFATLTRRPGLGPVTTPGQEPGKIPGEEKEAPPKEQKVKRWMADKVQEAAAALQIWPRVAGAFLKRDFLEEWTYPLSLSLRFLSIFFLVTMFYFLSRLIGQNVNPYLSPYGTDYFSFVLVGLGFSQYFDMGLSTFSHSLRDAQTTGTLEALLTSPTRISLIIISSSLWSFLLASVQVLFYFGMGIVFFKAELVSFSIPAVAAIIFLNFVCFSSLGIIAAGFIMVHKRGDPVIWLFGTISGLLSGIYYPVAILPDWLKSVASLLPNTYALEAVRKVFLQGATLGAVKVELFILVGFCLVLLPLSLLAFRLAVRKAKMDGSLSHY